ncbi:MAG: hypothetical protein PHC90_05885 [Syntrophorhabdaceae bacterium]|nr:hypothetical protein [Syntrophorhabdaceae bacterium]
MKKEEKTNATRREALKRIAERPGLTYMGKVVDVTAGGGGDSKDYGGYTIPVDTRKS